MATYHYEIFWNVWKCVPTLLERLLLSDPIGGIANFAFYRHGISSTALLHVSGGGRNSCFDSQATNIQVGRCLLIPHAVGGG